MPKGGWFWLVTFLFLLALPLLYPSSYFLGTCVVLALYATYNLMWRLVIGTAGIYSFATLATVGAGAYAASYTSITFGWHWSAMLVVATLVGTVTGFLIAVPAIRLGGVYFALFTLGLVELFRTTVIASRSLGTSQGLFNASSFVPDSVDSPETSVMIAYYGGLLLVGVALGVTWLLDAGRVGLFLRAARESETVTRALGIGVVSARFHVFLISSAVLGLAGGFYAAFYRGVAPSIFSFNLLVLLLAMMVVGGMHSSRGVLLGTALLLFIDQRYIDEGAKRLIAIGIVMLLASTLTPQGLAGIPTQVAAALRSARVQGIKKTVRGVHE